MISTKESTLKLQMNKKISDINWYDMPEEIHNCETLAEHFSDRYYFELERKEQINANISVYFGVAALLVGAFIKLLDFLPQYELKDINVLFWFILFIFLSCLIISSIYLIKSLFKNYQYVITPYKWIKHAYKTVEYYKEYNVDSKLEVDFKIDLTGQYAEYAEKNSFSNDMKSSNLANAKKWLVATLVFAIFGYTLMYMDKIKLKKISENLKVKIINKQLPVYSCFTKMEKIKMTNENKPQEKKETPPPRPRPESGGIINEGANPTPTPGRIITEIKKDIK